MIMKGYLIFGLLVAIVVNAAARIPSRLEFEGLHIHLNPPHRTPLAEIQRFRSLANANVSSAADAFDGAGKTTPDCNRNVFVPQHLRSRATQIHPRSNNRDIKFSSLVLQRLSA
jgi:hypothetical protein